MLFAWKKEQGQKPLSSESRSSAFHHLVAQPVMLGKLRPHIILMDVVLPGVDGLTATRYVQRLYPATKVAIVSAYDKFDYAQEALRAGAVDYLLKPVRPEQLVALLKKFG